MAELTAYQPASAASDASVSSSLGDVVDTTSPYSFAPTLTVGAGATVLTTITRASDASSVSVTGSTTATPTATLTAASATVGDSFHCESVATDGSFTDTVVTTVFMEGTGGGGGGKSWSNVHDVDFTASSTGALSSGTATIGGVDFDVTIPGGCTATDDANGIRVAKTGSGFLYFGQDGAASLTDIEKPWRAAFAVDDITVASGGNIGAAVYSAATPDATVRVPSAQLRVNLTGATYTDQPLHTTGAVGGSSAFTNPGSGAIGSAPTSSVWEVYGWGSMIAFRRYNGTTTIPAAIDPVDVFTDASWRIMSCATGGASSGSNPDFWAQLWASMVIGSGSAVSISADIVQYKLDEWG